MDAFKIYINGLKQCILLGSCLIQTILLQTYFRTISLRVVKEENYSSDST